MKTRTYLRRFGAYLASMLGIGVPRLRFSAELIDGGLRGGILNDGSELCVYAPVDLDSAVDADAAETIDVLFRIAHEMRHLWQMQCAQEMFEGYRPRSDLDLIGYNRQAAELDAHAFAALIIEANFGKAPQFQGLDDKTKELIAARKKEIYEDMRRTD